LHSLEQLIQDATSTKHLIKDLQQQEKMLANLYTILSKEMLLFALDEYLPVLSEIINSFLSQVVEYQISMKISETTDKLELEAKVYDEKGEREVKSLSGGQRTILKLVRMLAISSYLNTPLLFLDETINNLDGDTVGKVSEMINSFVKQRTMKFYTVTHNVEIQEMDIWDRVIEVGK
jgi:DNA repair exonuclease SbcCD ATPase subunit